MRRWLLAAGLLAAALSPALLSPAVFSPAHAADIDGPPPPRSGPYGGYYDHDPRYAPKVPPSYYEDDDDDNGRYRAPPPSGRYSTPPPHYAPPPPKYAAPHAGRGCVRSEQVRDRLTGEGWRDFHDGKPLNDRLVTLRARRPNGQVFELTLHRCSGQLIEARPLQLRPFGPYAYRQPYGPYGPWRWGRQTAPHAYQDDDGWEERYAYRGPRRWHDDD